MSITTNAGFAPLKLRVLNLLAHQLDFMSVFVYEAPVLVSLREARQSLIAFLYLADEVPLGVLAEPLIDLAEDYTGVIADFEKFHLALRSSGARFAEIESNRNAATLAMKESGRRLSQAEILNLAQTESYIARLQRTGSSLVNLEALTHRAQRLNRYFVSLREMPRVETLTVAEPVETRAERQAALRARYAAEHPTRIARLCRFLSCSRGSR